MNATATAQTVQIKDAATGTADVLNVVLTNAATTAFGTITAANVETINITSTDSATAFDAVHTATLVATKATSVTLSGNGGLTLTNTGNVALKTIDASGMSGALTVTAAGTVATTITGGSGADTLTSSTGTVADTLKGGAGNDRLIANAGLTQLEGGAGADTFVIGTAGANVNVYSTITDAAAGDKIEFANQGTETFARAKLTLGSTAVFQDYANLAAAGDGSTNGAISWFQFTDGNTYVVMDRSAGASFNNGTDLIVKLTGLVDLSAASFSNDTAPIIQLG